MKKNIIRPLLAIVCLLSSIGVYAHDFKVDGIYYRLLSEENQVAVTYYGDDEYDVPEEYKYTGSVTIPETVTYQGATYSVTSIGAHAFDCCSGLTEVTIPNSVTSIGYYAFFCCDGLTEITIPNNVTSIGDRAFTYCSSLNEITIPNSVTSIGDEAFYNCTGLTEVTIGNGVTSIGKWAFASCYRLTEVTIPNSVNSIGDGAFRLCTGLKEIIIPNSVTSIGYEAFFYCTGLTEVTIGSSVTSIGEWAFACCSSLNEITIPNSVTSIGDEAFYSCTGLTSMAVEEGNIVYDSRENCNAIIETATNTLITGCKNSFIPNSVTSIGESAFYGCNGLTEITIPNSVTSIGDEAFYYCTGLTEITIGNSVTSIGESAFAYCEGLTEMRIEAVNPPAIYDNTFEGVDKSIPLYVPAESVEAYRTADYWKYFMNITEDLTSGVENITCDNSDAPAEYYDLSGRRVDHPTHGIYIVKQGDIVRKVFVNKVR